LKAPRGENDIIKEFKQFFDILIVCLRYEEVFVRVEILLVIDLRFGTLLGKLLVG